MRRLLLCAVLLAAHLTHAAPGAHGPNGEHLDMPATAAPGGLARLPDGSVSVPMPAQRRMGLRTVLAESSRAHVALELPARVVLHPHTGAVVQAMQSGRIRAPEGGLPLAGQVVQKGQLLAWVEYKGDPHAQAAQQAQWAQLRGQLETARQRVERLQALQGTVAGKELQAAQTELASLTQRERSIGASVSAREPLLAPISGTLVGTHARIGQVVSPGDLLYEMVDEHEWMVEAVTSDASLPSRIQQAFLLGLPAARLTPHGHTRALREGLLPLHFSVQQARGALTLGQSVTVVVHLDEAQEGYVLPASALVRNPANETIVWIKSGTQRYIAQVVRAQPLDAASVLVVDGLGPDNRVVVQGAALLAQIR